MADSLQEAARWLGASLEPLARALSRSDLAIVAFVEQLGWTLPSVPQALKDLGATAQQIWDAQAGLEVDLSVQASGGTASADIAAQYVTLASNVISLIKNLQGLPAALSAQLPGAFVAATDFPNQFARRLLDVSLYEVMVANTKRMESILRLAGVVEVVQEPADPASFQPTYLRRTIRWDRLSKLLGDPTGLLIDVYGFNDPSFDGRSLLDAVMHLSFALAGPADLDWPTPARIQAITGALPTFDAVGPPQLIVPLLEHDLLQAGVSVLPLVASGGAPPGIALGLFARGGLPTTIQLSDMLTLQLDEPVGLATGLSVTLRPGRDAQARIGLEGPSGSDLGATRVGATLKIGRAEPIELLSLPGGSSLAATSVMVGGGVGARAKGPEPYLDVGLKGGKLTIDLGGRDGFLDKIMPGGPLELNFDLGLAWTPTGVALTGSGALTVSVPLHQQLGPFRLDTLYLLSALSDDALKLETSVSGGASLGPLDATVDRVGLQSMLSLTQGNLGPLDLEFAFKPPNGVGLAIDAGVVKGGGYLYIDTDHGRYAGALQLVILDFLNVSAIGLIDTKMPDGSDGFSLLIIITADFGPGIQLGFGFTLLAVGGLVGLNRSMLFQPIMDGVRTNAIASVMFPKDVIANAPRIISDLQAFFPPHEGTFLIGPMGKLGWGEPTLVSLSLGVIIEIPPGDIAILGILKLALPAEELAILVLQVNFAGAIEVDKQRIYFFASLFDSHILFITIDGGMGLLFAYGDDANFVVSVGGFHPRFNPPPLPFPSPQRISVNIINESFARIHCDGYFAVTTNTVQFGAHSDFFFGFSALSVEGASGFDALIQFSPFHFSVSISTSFSVHVFGVGVFGIGIALTVEGPTPFHANGTASLSFLFFSVDIGIEFTWGDSRETTLPPVAVMPMLTTELGKQSNWRALLPSGSNLLVSLRKLDPSETALVLHPVGMLRVSQRQVPLDLTLDKLGNQRPTDANRFALTVTSAGFTKTRDLQESFAPAQFKNMDDAGKLSQPAYAPQDSGIELAVGGTVYASGTAVTRIVRYDVTIVDTKLRRTFLKLFIFAGAMFQHLLRGASVARSPLSAYRKAQVSPYADAVTVSPETFGVALKSNNTAFRSDAVAFTSQAAANDYLARAVAGAPALAGTLHVLPQFEMAA